MSESVSARHELSESDERLLALVRAGYVDAEIAVRLGLGTGEVKHRIERLCTRLGAKDRVALRDGEFDSEPSPDAQQPTATPPARAGSNIGVIVGVVAGLALVGAAFLAGRNSQSTSTPATSVAQATGPTSPPATPTRTLPVAPNQDRPMYDLGLVFSVPPQVIPVESVETREAATLVTLRGAGLVLLDAGPIKWQFDATSPPGDTGFSVVAADIGGQPVRLLIETANESTRLLAGGTNEVAFYSSAPNVLPQLFVEAYGAGPRSFPNRHVSVDASGHLLIAAEDTPTSVVLNAPTGEALDVSGATAIAPMSRDVPQTETQSNDCTPQGCLLRVGGDVLAPVAGVVTCTGGVTRLAAGQITFLARRPTATGELQTCGDTGPRAAAIGDVVLAAGAKSGGAEVTAIDLKGLPLSVVTGVDRVVHVGVIAVRFACPCLRRN